MEHPQIRANLLHRLTGIANSISVIEHGRSYTTVRSHYAEAIFGKIALNVASLCRLLPATRKELEGAIDVSSIASLARNLVEAYNVLHYTCVERIPEEEREFRVYLMSLHHSIEFHKVLSSFSFDEDDMTRTIHTMAEHTCRSILEKNSYFQTLDEGTKKNLLKGSRAFFRKGGAIQRLSLNSDVETGIYKFLSNSVHSSPMSLMNYYNRAEANPLDSLGVLFLAVETAILYVAASINAYIRIRWKIAKLVSTEDKVFVKSLINDAHIMKWIEYRKWYDENHNFYKAIKKP